MCLRQIRVHPERLPLVSKVCTISMVPLATEIITSEFTGKESPIKDQKDREIPYYGVKEAVFPFNMFQEVDPLLGPEMRSTGEVLVDWHRASAKLTSKHRKQLRVRFRSQEPF